MKDYGHAKGYEREFRVVVFGVTNTWEPIININGMPMTVAVLRVILYY